MSIEERPEIVEKRARLGDWEADTIIGAGKRGAIVTLVERKSRLTLLKQVARRTAAAVEEAILDLLRPYQASTHTITFDNGKEFANHQSIAQELQAEYVFCSSIFILGAWHQREHEWAYSPVLPERIGFLIHHR